jgi:hypothetical protein
MSKLKKKNKFYIMSIENSKIKNED